MGGVEPGQALFHQPDRFLQRQSRLAAQPIGQRLPFHVLHGEEVMASVLIDRENGDHVGMGNLSRGRRLRSKTLNEIRVFCQFRRKDLDRHGAVQRLVVTPVDFAHPAAADPADDAIAPEPLEGQNVAVRLAGRRRQAMAFGRRIGHRSRQTAARRR